MPLPLPSDGPPAPPQAHTTDSIEAAVRRSADNDPSRRVVVSLRNRRLYLLEGGDTLLSAPVAVGSGAVLQHEGRAWDFSTPRGRRAVLRKSRDPVWVPPDWHYVELAQRWGWRLARLRPGRSSPLADGSRLVVRGRQVVRIHPGGRREPLLPGEEIVFDGILFIPPFGTANREVPGELGRYKLDMGDGYLLHGTPHRDSIGDAVTHGCIRLLDSDIELLYAQTPVGTAVYLF